GLPQKEYEEVLPIQEIAGLFLVQPHEGLGGDANALMIDRKGGIRHRLNRNVLTGKRTGQELVLLTSADVVCVSSNDKTHWKTPFARDEFVAGGDLVCLKNGDLLSCLFCRISDSGVQIMRLNGDTGEVVWRVECAPLGTSHSKYRHDAKLKVSAG